MLWAVPVILGLYFVGAVLIQGPADFTEQNVLLE